MSASEDRSAKLWSGRAMDSCAATIAPPCGSTVCCADFSSSSEHLVALACSSHNVYCYDLRYRAQPLVVLDGHKRATSYVRFFGADRLITASIDGSLACWELGLQQQQQVVVPMQPPRHPKQQQQEARSEEAMQEEVARMLEQQRLSQHQESSDVANAWCSGLSSSSGRVRLGRGGRGREGAALSEYEQWRQQQQEDCDGEKQVATCSRIAAAGGESGPSKLQQRRSFTMSATAVTGGAAAVARQQQRQHHVQQPWKRFEGHTNCKNFVGLSVRPEDGLLACGSETDQVFTYHTSWSQPLATFSMSSSTHAASSRGSTSSDSTAFGVHGAPLTGFSGAVGACVPRPGEFVSAVAWQPWRAAQVLGLPKLLAAATSMGGIRLLSLVEP